MQNITEHFGFVTIASQMPSASEYERNDNVKICGSLLLWHKLSYSQPPSPFLCCFPTQSFGTFCERIIINSRNYNYCYCFWRPIHYGRHLLYTVRLKIGQAVRILNHDKTVTISKKPWQFRRSRDNFAEAVTISILVTVIKLTSRIQLFEDAI